MTLSGLRGCFSALLFAQCGESDVCELLIFPKDKAALTPIFFVRELNMQCCDSRNSKCITLNKKHSTQSCQNVLNKCNYSRQNVLNVSTELGL